MKKETLIGIVLITIGLVFGIFETIYFGYNILPNTLLETFCDILSVGLVIVGVIKLDKIVY